MMNEQISYKFAAFSPNALFCAHQLELLEATIGIASASVWNHCSVGIALVFSISLI